MSFHHYQLDHKKEWVENHYDGGLVILESPYQRKEESDMSTATEIKARNKWMRDWDTLIEQSP